MMDQETTLFCLDRDGTRVLRVRLAAGGHVDHHLPRPDLHALRRSP